MGRAFIDAILHVRREAFPIRAQTVCYLLIGLWASQSFAQKAIVDDAACSNERADPFILVQSGKQFLKSTNTRDNYNVAFKCFNVAAKSGYSDAQFFVGMMLHTGDGVARNDGEALKWLRLAAAQGNASAEAYIGGMYVNGEGVEKNASEGVKWILRAAARGLDVAEATAGEAYETGNGVSQDTKEAERWYRLAAQHGFTEAQYRLGRMYLFGKEITTNYPEAIRWLTSASEKGHVSAQMLLGYMYAGGIGVSPDPVAAHVLFSAVAQSDDESFAKDGRKDRDQIEKTMTRAQIAEAGTIFRNKLRKWKASSE